MGTKLKAKTKATAKIAKAKAKIANKCKKCCAMIAPFGVMFILTGCATSDAQQPAKANTMENKFEKCVIVIAAKARIPMDGTNKVVEVEGNGVPTVEMFTQTQSLENSGSETTTQTATQTPTNDVKPDVDVTVPVTKGAGGDAADAAASLVSGAIKGAKEGCSSSTSSPTQSSDCSGDACKPSTACSGAGCKD